MRKKLVAALVLFAAAFFVMTPASATDPPGDDLGITISVDVTCEGYTATVVIDVREGHLFEVTAPGFFEEGQASETGTVTVTPSGSQTSGTVRAVNFGENKPSIRVEESLDFSEDCETPPPSTTTPPPTETTTSTPPPTETTTTSVPPPDDGPNGTAFTGVNAGVLIAGVLGLLLLGAAALRFGSKERVRE